MEHKYATAVTSVVALMLPATLAGCSDSTGSSNGAVGSAEKRYSVAFVTAGVNLLGYKVMRCVAEDTADRLNLDLTWQGTPSTDASSEMTVLQSVIARKPDGIILVPWDSNAFVAPVKQLMESGTPVVTADGSLGEPVDVANVRTNNIEAGKDAATALGAELGGSGSVAILTDSPGNVVQNQRWEGFKDELESSFPDIDVLPVEYVGPDNAKAASIASSVISGHSDLKAFYSTQDSGVNGAAAAIRDAGKDIKNIGWDATPATVALLRDGTVDGLVSQNFPQEAELMVETINTALREPDADIEYDIYPSTKYLTRDNIDEPSSKDFIYEPSC